MPEKIKILMKLFHMSNKDIADLLQVDVSLVSKWRSGARDMRANPDYILKLVRYIVKIDAPGGYKRCYGILWDCGITDETLPENILEGYIKDWLCDSLINKQSQDFVFEIINNKYMTNVEHVYHWEGKKGRREAIKILTERALAKDGESEIVSYITEGNDWFHEDPEFHREWKSLILRFMEEGNKMEIIHPLNRKGESLLASILCWLPIHLECKVKGYYLRQYSLDEAFYITLIALKGDMVILSISDRINPSALHTWMYFNSAMTASADAISTRLLERSSALFKRYFVNCDNPQQFMTDQFSIYDRDSECYFLNDFGRMVPSNTKILQELLKAENLTDLEIDRISMFAGMMANLRKDCKCFYLVDIYALSLWLSTEKVLAEVLSMILGREIYLSMDTCARLIEMYIDEIAMEDNLFFGIHESEEAGQFQNMAIICGGDRFSAFASMVHSDTVQILGMKEPTVSAAIYSSLVEYWTATPFLMKEKSYAIKTIKRAISDITYR